MTLKVGITGGIGSGKTTVCTLLEILGYPVYYADIEAKAIAEKNKDVVAAISKLFGPDIYELGKLDRKRLASIVFSNDNLLNALNNIIHPAVAAHFEEWVTSKVGFSIVFKEAAILFESGAYKQLNKSILVTAPVDVRVNRVVARDGVTADEVIRRMSSQLPEEQLLKMADYTIKNGGSELLMPQVLNIIDNLKVIANNG